MWFSNEYLNTKTREGRVNKYKFELLARNVYHFGLNLDSKTRLLVLFISVLFQSEKDTEDQCGERK